MANSILPISGSKLVDYSDKPLQNFWQSKDPKTHLSRLEYKEIIIEFLKSVFEGVVCIQSASISDKQVIKQIFDTARGRDIKIYLLVNQYSPELDLLNGVCLIRYDLNNTGSFVLANPNSRQSNGLFFGGQLTERSLTSSNQILSEINEKEICELFRHFCFHFWETAKKEVKEEGKHISIDSKPIDVFHDTSTKGERDFIYSTLFYFVESISRIKFSGSLIVPFKKENENPILIKSTDSVEMGNINPEQLLSFQEFKSYSPDFIDTGTACKIEYKWTNVPYYLPDKSNESLLYEKWKKESEKIDNYLESILQRIKSGLSIEKTLSKALSRFFLGKVNFFNKLKSEIEEIKQIVFSHVSEKRLKEMITTINQICIQVDGEIEEIELEDRKAKLKEEIFALEKKDVEKNKLLSEKKSDLNEKQKNISEKLKEFLEKHKIDESLLGKKKSEWQKHSAQRTKQKNPKEVQEAESRLSELNEIQNQVFIDKIKGEIEHLERDIKRNIDEIKRKEIEKSKSNQNTEAKSSLEVFVTEQYSKHSQSKNGSLVVPDLPQLPKVGILYQLNDQTYLAIEYWEQYDQGKIESERLNANLCAIKT